VAQDVEITALNVEPAADQNAVALVSDGTTARWRRASDFAHVGVEITDNHVSKEAEAIEDGQNRIECGLYLSADAAGDEAQ